MAKFNADADNVYTNPIKGAGFDSPQMTGVLVLGALGMLILIRRGFRGVNAFGAGISVS